jgi:hypothetical protein
MADFGPWPRVNDRASALQAIRMSGLPVFLMGAMSLLFAAVTMGTVAGLDGMAVTRPAPLIMAAVLGAGLVGIGLALRRGAGALVPIATVITLGLGALAIWMGVWIALPIQAVFAAVAMSGLRGWWWLRRQS